MMFPIVVAMAAPAAPMWRTLIMNGSFGADNKARGSGPDDERGAVGDMENISFRKIISLRVCAEDVEDRLHEED